MSLMKLAKAVYPNLAWYEKNGRCVYNQHSTWQSMEGPVAEVTVIELTPATNPAQFVDVLAWLFRMRCVQTHTDGCSGLSLRFEFEGDENMYFFTDSSSLMLAAKEAACRVAESL